MNDQLNNFVEWITQIITDRTTLAILTWIGSIGACIVGIGFFFKFVKKAIQFFRKMLMLKDIFLDNTSVRLIKELSNEGIINFFPYPQTYMEYKDHGKPAEYMKIAKNKLLYVGFWLTHSIGLGGIPETLKVLLNSGVEVSIVLMNPFNKETIKHCKNFFMFDQSYIENEFTRAITTLYHFYQSPALSKNEKNRLHLKLHAEPLHAAVFLIDWDDEHNGKILLDTKIHSIEFSDGYGFEIKNNPKINIRNDSLYNRIKKSYLAFVENGKRPFIQTIDIDLDTEKSIDGLIKEIILKTDEIR